MKSPAGNSEAHMTTVPLTTFIDFVCASGTPKMTVVKAWKMRGEYDPASDYYKRLREGIIALHEDDEPESSLDAICATAAPPKRANYLAMADAYKKWLKRKDLAWFPPTKGEWKSGGLVVQVRPELGLEINGQRCLVKLYFKADPLPRTRADLILHLLNSVCAKRSKDPVQVAILDVRKAKLVTGSPAGISHELQLEGEAAYWMTVWNRL